jgi:ubiquinone biosynthesis protein
MRQVLELGVFHADPHPGNIIIIPPDKIGLVDFGMAGQLDRHRNISFLMLLAAGKNRHMDLMIDILTDMNAVNPETNFDLLKRDMAILLDKYRALPLKHISFQMIFNEIATLARNHKVFLPRDFVLVFKSLVVISGTAMQLDPTLNPTEVIEEKVREAFGKLFDRQNISRELTMGMWHSGLLLKELPEHLRDFSRKLLRGQIKTQMDIPQMDNLIRELDHSSNRLSFSMIIAAIIIGSSMIFNTQVGPKWGGVPLLGLTGYIVAGIMGLWLVVAILRSGKLS